MQGSVAAPWAHAEVVGLQVAVRDALAFQHADDLEQVIAEAVEKVEAQSAMCRQAIGQCEPIAIVGIAGGGESKRRAAADAFDAEELAAAAVAQVCQGTGFVAQTLGVLLVLGDLEHLRRGGTRPTAQKRDGGRTTAEPALNLPTSLENVALVGSQGIGGWWLQLGRRLLLAGFDGGSQLIEGTVEEIEELTDSRTIRRHRIGRHGHECLEVLGRTVHRCR